MRAIFLLFALVGGASAQTFKVAGCDVYFSPHGGATEAIVKQIDGAQQSIHLLAYNFTSQAVGDALVRAKARGVAIELVLDRSVPTERNSILPAMLSVGIPTWIDQKHKIAHNKVIIIDGKIVETGSFNYTDSAENSNGENALICASQEGAAAYEIDFERHKAHSVRR